MNDWTTIGEIISSLPPVLITVLASAAVIIFIVGFGRRGLNFIKYGFGGIGMEETMEKRFDRLDERFDKVDERLDKVDGRLDKVDGRLDRMDERLDKMDERFDKVDERLDGMETDMGNLRTELTGIKTNHFGHLKGFLSELTSILLDKDVINNADRARLDNQLREM
ncbi:MAG: hemolysin XhlA family protein [Treponema sp.]|nr:hemolysin XhlA family protein [Treponema sp.]